MSRIMAVSPMLSPVLSKPKSRGSWRSAAGDAAPLDLDRCQESSDQSRISSMQMSGKSRLPTSGGFPTKWPTERSSEKIRKDNVEAVAAHGNGHHVNLIRSPSSSPYTPSIMHSENQVIADASSAMQCTDDEDKTGPRGVRPGHSWRHERAQSAHPSRRPAEQSPSFSLKNSTRSFDIGLDLPPESPVYMKSSTVNVGSVALIYGESYVGDMEKDASPLKGSRERLHSESQRQMYHKRFNESTCSNPVRSAIRVALLTGTKHDESPSSVTPSRCRLASATRRGPNSSGWIDISPASRSNVWAKARPKTATGLRNTMSLGFSVTGYSQTMHGSPSKSAAASLGVQLLVGGNACKKPDQVSTTFWKGASNLGYRKRAPTERPLPMTVDA